MAYRQPPMVVVLPDTTEQVSQVLNIASNRAFKWCRGAPVPRCPAVRCHWPMLCCSGLGKFKRIREIDFDNRVVLTEPG